MFDKYATYIYQDKNKNKKKNKQFFINQLKIRFRQRFRSFSMRIEILNNKLYIFKSICHLL